MIPGLCSLVYRGGKGTSGSFTVTASPTTTTTDGSVGSNTSPVYTASVSGGTPAYSYHWLYQSGDPSISITTPTASTTQFSYNATTSYVTTSATFLCQVTDASSRVVDSNLVTAIFHITPH